MIEFKKYSSIENSFDKDFMDHVVTQMPTDLVYVVQEKVHGANTSFLCDGNEVQFAKRTSQLAENDAFYEFQELLDRYKGKVLNLFDSIKQHYLGVTHISVFGELFGGVYPHNDVPINRKLTHIQKGVFYTPEHEFYGFDIYLFSENGNWFLPVDEVNDLFEKHGFFYAKTLFKGTLKECLEYPNAFQSHIAEWLGLPPIDDNICEGVVIRPVTPMYMHNGSRVLIKNKNARFSEKKEQKKRNKIFSEPVPFSDELKQLLVEMEVFITENRLANVVSHIGEVHLPQDFGKLLGLFSKDIFDDFIKEFGGSYSALDKCEQKTFNKEVNKLATSLIKKVYFS